MEKDKAGSITIREKLELKIHLACCSVCRKFERQSIVINKLVHNLFHEPKLDEFKLDDEFKKEMQDQIIENLKKIKVPKKGHFGM